MSTRALGSRSFESLAWLSSFLYLPSFLPSYERHSPCSLNCRIDHSRSPRGRPSRSSRGSGTADCLTRRPVVRLHMTQPPQSLLRRGRFYGSLPLARRECPPPPSSLPPPMTLSAPLGTLSKHAVGNADVLQGWSVRIPTRGIGETIDRPNFIITSVVYEIYYPHVV